MIIESMKFPTGKALRMQDEATTAAVNARRKAAKARQNLAEKRSRFIARRSRELAEQGVSPGQAWTRAADEFDRQHPGIGAEVLA